MNRRLWTLGIAFLCISGIPYLRSTKAEERTASQSDQYRLVDSFTIGYPLVVDIVSKEKAIPEVWIGCRDRKKGDPEAAVGRVYSLVLQWKPDRKGLVPVRVEDKAGDDSLEGGLLFPPERWWLGGVATLEWTGLLIGDNDNIKVTVRAPRIKDEKLKLPVQGLDVIIGTGTKPIHLHDPSSSLVFVAVQRIDLNSDGIDEIVVGTIFYRERDLYIFSREGTEWKRFDLPKSITHDKATKLVSAANADGTKR